MTPKHIGNMFTLSELVVLMAVLSATASGYFVSIDAHAEECFYERVNSGTKMGLMFEVAEGGFLDIDVEVNPFNEIIKMIALIFVTVFFTVISLRFRPVLTLAGPDFITRQRQMKLGAVIINAYRIVLISDT